MLFKKFPERSLNHLLSAPFIYAVFIPLVFLDIVLELYHRICFPLYGLEYVSRGDYIIIDRHKLSYLDFFEKLNCVYCGYANGLLAYSVRIAGETEKYWCGIKHSKKVLQPHQKDFAEYDDKKDFMKKYG